MKNKNLTKLITKLPIFVALVFLCQCSGGIYDYDYADLEQRYIELEQEYNSYLEANELALEDSIKISKSAKKIQEQNSQLVNKLDQAINTAFELDTVIELEQEYLLILNQDLAMYFSSFEQLNLNYSEKTLLSFTSSYNKVLDTIKTLKTINGEILVGLEENSKIIYEDSQERLVEIKQLQQNISKSGEYFNSLKKIVNYFYSKVEIELEIKSK